jgi:hypothetical protein
MQAAIRAIKFIGIVVRGMFVLTANNRIAFGVGHIRLARHSCVDQIAFNQRQSNGRLATWKRQEKGKTGKRN